MLGGLDQPLGVTLDPHILVLPHAHVSVRVVSAPRDDVDPVECCGIAFDVVIPLDAVILTPVNDPRFIWRPLSK
jgi:hypothetical protein